MLTIANNTTKIRIFLTHLITADQEIHNTGVLNDDEDRVLTKMYLNSIKY